MLDKGRISSVTPTIKINRVSCWMWGPAEARDSIGKVPRGGNCPGSGTKRAPACDFRTEDSFETTETTLADCRSGGGCHLGTGSADTHGGAGTATEAQVREAAALAQQSRAGLTGGQSSLDSRTIWARMDETVVARNQYVGQPVAESPQARAPSAVAHDL